MLLANTGLSDCGILAGYSGESWAFTRHLNSQQEVLGSEGYEGEADSGTRAVGCACEILLDWANPRSGPEGKTCFAGTYQ